MNQGDPKAGRVALLWPGDREARSQASLEKSRFGLTAQALAAAGLFVEPAVYSDDFALEVEAQLKSVDGVLVWVNPIEGDRDRSVLDAMLARVAQRGVFVSARPDVILKMGTKEVLYQTRNLGWGCDTGLYRNPEELRKELPGKLAGGGARVLKQYRGNGGNGVWKVWFPSGSSAAPRPESLVRVRHALRGSVEEEMPLSRFFEICEIYFRGAGRMIDQAYQERLPEGMIRCYFVHGKVAGFGHQAINALYPAPPGGPPTEAPQPGPRLYHPPTKPEFQLLRQKAEAEWVPALRRELGLETGDLPILWDADFLLGPKTAAGEDSHVLCEINVSSVYPFPDSALPALAQAVKTALNPVNPVG